MARVQVQGLNSQFGAPHHPTDRRRVVLFDGVPGEGQALSSRAQKPDYKIDHATGCWEWQKSKLRGYGMLSLNGKDTWAHRAYWIAANGPVPEGRHVVIDHLCRNPGCVNPKHLEAVEQATNVHRGSLAKLNMEVARKVRARVAAGQSSAQIKAELGVSIQNIWWIAEDRAWREDPTAPRNPVRPVRECQVCKSEIPRGRHRAAVYCSDPCRRHAYYQRRQGRAAA